MTASSPATMPSRWPQASSISRAHLVRAPEKSTTTHTGSGANGAHDLPQLQRCAGLVGIQCVVVNVLQRRHAPSLRGRTQPGAHESRRTRLAADGPREVDSERGGVMVVDPCASRPRNARKDGPGGGQSPTGVANGHARGAVTPESYGTAPRVNEKTPEHAHAHSGVKRPRQQPTFSLKQYHRRILLDDRVRDGNGYGPDALVASESVATCRDDDSTNGWGDRRESHAGSQTLRALR